MEKAKSERVLSIDAARGFDMFWIIGGSGLITQLVGNVQKVVILRHF